MNNDPVAAYEATANALVDRIAALIPANPQILTMTSAWDLFKVPGFDCADLQPSFAQASIALVIAKQRHAPSLSPSPSPTGDQP